MILIFLEPAAITAINTTDQAEGVYTAEMVFKCHVTLEPSGVSTFNWSNAAVTPSKSAPGSIYFRLSGHHPKKTSLVLPGSNEAFLVDFFGGGAGSSLIFEINHILFVIGGRE